MKDGEIILFFFLKNVALPFLGILLLASISLYLQYKFKIGIWRDS